MVGTRINELRKAKGLSIRALATRAAMSTSALHRVLHDRQEARTSQASRLAAALDVAVAELFGEGGAA